MLCVPFSVKLMRQQGQKHIFHAVCLINFVTSRLGNNLPQITINFIFDFLAIFQNKDCAIFLILCMTDDQQSRASQSLTLTEASHINFSILVPASIFDVTYSPIASAYPSFNGQILAPIISSKGRSFS